MSSFFKNKTKAEILVELSKKKIKFKIPHTFFFDVRQWLLNPDKITNSIILNFKKKKIKYIVVRSSSKDEDKLDESNAGKFYSQLKIPIKKNKIVLAIEKVIKSYKKYSGSVKILDNQILIQEMILNTSMSGVVFTKDLNTGANYYSINYDDVTGLTNTVTSGIGEFSNRTLLIYKKAFKQIRSPRFKNLILAVKNLEKKVKDENIDIEFGVNKKFKPYLFQARSIIKNDNWKSIDHRKIDKSLVNIEKKLKLKFKRQINISGKTTVLGQMPDWNPAEIIGKNPSNLAYSLYSELITNNIWGIARKMMGYKNLSENKLMTSIGNQPYIDVRLSFNSFLPNELKKSISEKIVDFSIEKLKKNPNLHDKIEFDIAVTSFCFNFNKKVKSLYGPCLKKKEIQEFKKHIKKLTINNVDISKKGSLNKALFEVSKLEKIQQKENLKDISYLSKIINNCKEFGTLQFSILARHGFIGRDLLISLQKGNILTQKDIDDFYSSIETITSEMLKDLKYLDNREFIKKYGHLRPGTYDIMSKRYDQTKKFIISKNLKYKKKNHFKINKIKKNKIEKLLNLNNFKIKSSDELFKYIEIAIISREYAKFVFTRSISNILEIIAKFGKKINISRNELSYLPLKFFLNSNYLNKTKLIKNSKRNRNKHDLAKSIRLPQVIYDQAGAKVIPFQVNIPNFITRKKVETSKIFLDNRNYNVSLKKKLIMIENADPGFDWIFSQKISGLITKYGGVNSHMAIRCAELGLPAAIGCGEKSFEELKKFEIICLDCASSNIYGV